MRHRIAPKWPEDLTERLIKLWNDGHSASQIAKQLRNGLTRAGVIGKVHRLRAQGVVMRVADAPQPKGIVASFTKRRDQPPSAKSSPDQPLPPAALLDVSAARPWTTRTFGECAYPVAGEGADTMSCCLETGGATYCAAHRRIMTAKPISAAQRAHLAKMRAAKMRKAA